MITQVEVTDLELSPSQMLDQILYHLSTDKDRDVRYYVSSFITEACLEGYKKKRAEQEAKELAIKENAIAPPNLPEHLVMMHSPLLSTLEEEEEEEEDVSIQDDEKIYQSTESPMDIVDDYDDIEDMPLTGNMASDYECTKDDEDQVIPFIDLQSNNNSTAMEEDDIMMELASDNHEVTEKAQHVYLSKVPAHVVLSSDITSE